MDSSFWAWVVLALGLGLIALSALRLSRARSLPPDWVSTRTFWPARFSRDTYRRLLTAYLLLGLFLVIRAVGDLTQ